MKREIHLFFTALGFYTRLPVSGWIKNDPADNAPALRYFPAVGWVTGGILSLLMISASYLFSPVLSVLLAITAGILLTGGFHEDGLADVCDGFGGGWTKEKILRIMKDSSVGTFGVLGMIIILAFRFQLLYEIFNSVNTIIFIIVLLSSHSMSRFMAIILMYGNIYARDDETSKVRSVVKEDMSTTTFYVAAITGAVPLIMLMIITHSWFYILPLFTAFLITWCLRIYFRKWIGGYTGDCLGATQQITEVIILLTVMALWNFI